MTRRDLLLRRLRLLASSTLLLLLIVGCMCGGPDDPPRAFCDDFDAATIDGIELRARYEIGGQGSDMLMLDVTYLGDAAPECGELNFRVVDPATGNELRSGNQAVQTSEIVGGRATREPYWMFWEFGSRVEVTVTAYGQSATAEVCRGDCVEEDAGVDAGAEPDAGVDEDAGPAAVDAGPAAVDAGPAAVDAGPAAVDAGPAPADAG